MSSPEDAIEGSPETAGGSPKLCRAIQQYRSGFTLPQYLYTSEEAFRIDEAYIAENLWICAGHESQLPAPGHWFIFKIANESVIVVRDSKQGVHAFYNVCPHRGARVCLEDQGSTNCFVCPYHAWSFNLDGTLRGAPDVPADFEKHANGLRPCHAQVFEGLIFLSLAAVNPPDFFAFTKRLHQFLEPYGLREAKLAARQNFSVRSNWKLVPENTFECYHCPSGHRAYAKVHDLRSQSAIGTDGPGIHTSQRTWESRARAAGFLPEAFEDSSESANFQAGMRFEVGFGNLTASSDGQPLAPLMAKRIGFDGGWTYLSANPLLSFLCYSDFVVTLSVVPQEAMRTDYIASWYVIGEAVERRDYDVGRLTALLGVAMAEDQALINQNQDGILSRAYRPGRFTAQEARSAQLLDWYIQHVMHARIGPVRAGIDQSPSERVTES